MIIDEILNRKDGADYTAESMRYIYDEATTFGYTELARALDGGDNSDIVRELCAYIDDNGYRKTIKEYVRGQNWIAAA